MHYVKQFHINGVDTKQVACIELQGAPNAATEGAVGVLGMDMLSPTHEVYRCVAVTGSVYTWELLSAGMSIVSATITGEGGERKSFPYGCLRVPDNYILKSGDLILDSKGYLYQVDSIGWEECVASYCGTHIGGIPNGDKDYTLVVKDGKLQLVTESGNVISKVDYLTADNDTLHRDSNGVAKVYGVRTINDTPLHLFVGTKAEYDTLTDVQKNNLFAIITDDTAKEDIDTAINTMNARYNSLDTALYHSTNYRPVKAAENVRDLYYHSLKFTFTVKDKSNLTDRGTAILEIQYTSPVTDSYSNKFLPGVANVVFPYRGSYTSDDGNTYDIISYSYTGAHTVSGYHNISLVVRDRNDPATDITMDGCFNTFTTDASRIALY